MGRKRPRGHRLIGRTRSLLFVTCATVVVGGMATPSTAVATTGPSGAAFAWGYNCCGEIGNGTLTPSAQPTQVQAPAGVKFVAVSTGFAATLAIGSDNNLYTWGMNGTGELGDGTFADHPLPHVVELAPGVSPKAVSAGQGFALAIGSDGQLYAWGNNDPGFGDPNQTGLIVNHPSPKVLTLVSGVSPRSIAAGNGFAFAIGSDGNLYGFGENIYWTLGDGTNVSQAKPEVITLAPGVAATAVSTAASSVMAIGSDGQLYGWGYNLYGQLAGTEPFVFTPSRISLAAGVKPRLIAMGSFSGYAVGTDKNLYAWGYNGDGELGLGVDGPRQVDVPTRIALPGGEQPVSIAAGLGDAFAIGKDGTLYGWGYNAGWQVGNGTTDNVMSPVAIRLDAPRGAAYVAASASTSDTVALTRPGH